MRVLVLGAGGMLGHKLMQRLAVRGLDVVGTVRTPGPDSVLKQTLPDAQLIGGVSADDFDSIQRVIQTVRPHAVANCIGIIKQLDEAKNPIVSISVNALFPHRLAEICAKDGIRLIHFSTDCVFSGDKGLYSEDSVSDARDLYGRTKFLGEVSGTGSLTIRSSIIGHELRGHRSLIDWFVSQNGGRIKGFANALYTGVTTPVMADLVATLIVDWPQLDGVWQVASAPISKYDLLMIARAAYRLEIRIDRDEAFFCDRRLDGSRFHARTGWTAPSWPDMIRALYEDWRTYHFAPELSVR